MILDRSHGISLRAVLAIALLGACPPAAAGEQSWSKDAVSPAINYAQTDVGVAYMAADGYQAGPSGGAISRVHAQIDYAAGSAIDARLCWNGTVRCVTIPAHGSITTGAFNGLDPSRPIYLVYRARGKGPLPTPVFVKGTVVVWYGPG